MKFITGLALMLALPMLSLAQGERSIKITGIITDAETRKPVEFATLVLHQASDSLAINGSMTDEQGLFEITASPGTYYLAVSSLSHDKWSGTPFTANKDLKLEPITLGSISKELKEVTIVAEKAEMVNNLDKKVYNVEKNIVNAGGTAADVLQQIPSVSVDFDGKLSLRGSANVQVLIDGKPSGITGGDRQSVLQQVPANMIESVEVITAPSSRYDAEGMAGIINIRTKKGKKPGINGNVVVGYGTWNKYNASSMINYRTEKMNLNASYSMRHDDRYMHGFADIYNHLPDTTFYNHTNTRNRMWNDFHNVRLSTDFFINKQNTLGLVAGYTYSANERDERVRYIFSDALDVPQDTTFRYATPDDFTHTIDALAEYRHMFTQPGHEWLASVSFSQSNQTLDALYNFYEPIEYNPFQISHSDYLNRIITAQTDYIHPIGTGKIEGGLKSTIRFNDIDQVTNTRQSELYVFDPKFSDHFIYKEFVPAAYTMYTGKTGKLQYSAGVRAEYTRLTADSRSTDTVFTRSYLSFFPSASVKISLPGQQDLQLSYARRLTRPTLGQLNPQSDFTDSLNVRRGNPYLNPEFINSFELGYSKAFNFGVSFLGTLYYRHISDPINFFRDVDPATGIALLQSRNYLSTQNLGLELVLRYNFKNIVNAMWSADIRRSDMSGSNLAESLQNTALIWNSRINLTVRITKSTFLQVTGMYNAPARYPQATIRGMGNGLDVGIRQDILKGRATIAFNVTDVSDDRIFKVRNESTYSLVNAQRKRESRVATLSFTWKFGSEDKGAAKPRSRNIPNEMPGGEGGGGM